MKEELRLANKAVYAHAEAWQKEITSRRAIENKVYDMVQMAEEALNIPSISPAVRKALRAIIRREHVHSRTR